MPQPNVRTEGDVYDLEGWSDEEEPVLEEGDSENEAETETETDSVELAVEDHDSRFSHSQITTITSVLATLRASNISPIQLTLYILDPTRSSTRGYRAQAYRAEHQFVPLLLSSIRGSKSGKANFDEWMSNDGMTWVHNRVDRPRQRELVE